MNLAKLGFLLALLLSGAATAATPKAFRAEYQVHRDGDLLGTATLSYQGNGDVGEFLSVIHGTAGLAAIAGVEIEERSQLRWRGDAPETVSYHYRQKAAWQSRQRSVSVDPRVGTIVSTDKDRRSELPYQPGVLDRNAVTLALMQALAKGAQTMTLIVVDRGKISSHRYTVAAKVQLKTALGTRPALRVERQRESDNGKSTTLWFDRERGYLPLRILQSEANGERLDLKISAMKKGSE